MWSGAVNRQPGYRARNLQRRGFQTFLDDGKPIITSYQTNLINTEIVKIVVFSTIWSPYRDLPPEKNHSQNASIELRFCQIKTFPWSNMRLSPKSKMNDRIFRQTRFCGRIFLFSDARFSSGFPPREYYVGRRGKPPTWLPRQKLAEERIPMARIIFRSSGIDLEQFLVEY